MVIVMKRKIMNKLLDWKNDANNKPLMVLGARQVGKTYIINEFCKNNFKNYISVNLLDNDNIVMLYERKDINSDQKYNYLKNNMNNLYNILNNEEGIDLAIDLVLYVMKKQLFLDGNKRTAIIFANHYLITHALGLIVVPAEQVKEYKKVLISYYEDESKKGDIVNFLKEKCWIKMK